MKKPVFKAFLMILALSLLYTTASADMLITAEKVITYDDQPFNWRFPEFVPSGDAVICEQKGGYVLKDVDGNVISKVYDSMNYNNPNDYAVLWVALDGKWGAVDATGKEVVPPLYFDVESASDKWVIGLYAEIVDKDIEHEYTNGARITQADIYYDGTLVASLTRDEYRYSKALGDYLAVTRRKANGEFGAIYISKTGERRDAKYASYQYDGHYGNITHIGSGLKAFEAGCTLDPDSVVPSLWHVSGNLYADLYGNTFTVNGDPNGFSDSEASYCSNGYIAIESAEKKWGIYSLGGEEIVPFVYDEICGKGNLFRNGYQLVVRDGMIGYIDEDGQATTDFGIRYSDSIKGPLYNCSFIWITDPLSAKEIIISAAAGQLPKQYDKVATYQSDAVSFVLGVQDNNLCGVIDIYGNEIVPLKYDNITVSRDGSMAVGQYKNSSGKEIYDVYKITCTQAEPAPETESETPEQAQPESAWTCLECGLEGNTGNFCPNCAAPRPPMEWICPECGHEGNTGNFCPNCAAPRP